MPTKRAPRIVVFDPCTEENQCKHSVWKQVQQETVWNRPPGPFGKPTTAIRYYQTCSGCGYKKSVNSK